MESAFLRANDSSCQAYALAFRMFNPKVSWVRTVGSRQAFMLEGQYLYPFPDYSWNPRNEAGCAMAELFDDAGPIEGKG